jgi:hypothetical protein
LNDSPFEQSAPRDSRAMCCSAGVSPSFLQCVEIRKIAGETPALRKTWDLCWLDGLRFTDQHCAEK